MKKYKPALNFLLELLYIKTPSSSAAQFEHDFGCYPPKPLRSIRPETKFNIRYITKLGRSVYLLEIVKRVFSGSKSGISDVFLTDESMRQMLREINESRGKIRSVIHDFQRLGLAEKIILFTLMIVISPILLMVLSIPVARLFRTIIKASQKESYGEFLPVLDGDLEIIVRMDFNGSKKGDAIKSHEHIHLIQYLSRIEVGEKYKGKPQLKRPVEIIGEEFSRSLTIKYLFEPNEIEARLHEVVLSYYRANGSLPLEFDQFILSLATSKNLSKVILDSSQYSKELLGSKPQEIIEYSVRDEQSAKELAYTIIAIRSKCLREKFILEVLPVMYGNLLGYYGDQDSRNIFLSKIHRPNLYDSLWNS